MADAVATVNRRFRAGIRHELAEWPQAVEVVWGRNRGCIACAVEAMYYTILVDSSLIFPED